MPIPAMNAEVAQTAAFVWNAEAAVNCVRVSASIAVAVTNAIMQPIVMEAIGMTRQMTRIDFHVE